ncbi:VOC family protein [Pelagicoccus sp. SDUM812002]|uniref:VOC family protein n=1 Tax=Pelagicoccus sp. SDUM812002 TaxID=3041266 RepID=UPI00280FA2B1|nr:VOC family protein [Pelagicoccus sp. SDUM812002]MDQ8186879.1 VOC family protein [Pelagicoccus sp. SDUM812002]
MIKFLHTRVRVADLQKSLDFYCKHCGFEVFKGPNTSPQGNQIVHLQLPGNDHMLELTYSPDFKVEFPEDLMHTCIGVDDIKAFCQKLEDDGVEVWPENWKEKEDFSMAFITDPDGYEVEILPNQR